MAKYGGEGVCLWGQGNFWDEMGINYWSVASLRQDGEEKIEESTNKSVVKAKLRQKNNNEFIQQTPKGSKEYLTTTIMRQTQALWSFFVAHQYIDSDFYQIIYI